MRRAISRPIALWGLVLLLVGVISPGATGLFTNPPAGGDTASSVAGSPHSSPVMFIENVGQFFDPSAGSGPTERVRFQVWGGPGTMWLTEDAIWITVLERPDNETKGPEDRETVYPSLPHLVSPSPQRGVNLRLTFPGANPHPRIVPFDRLDTVVSYFIGNDPDQWHPDVPVWAGVRYVDLYPGVDLVVGAGLAPAQGQLHGSPLPWRLEAHQNADLSTVRLRMEGAGALTLDGNALHITTAVGSLTLPLLTVEGLALQVKRSNVERVNMQTFDVATPFALTDDPAVSGDVLRPLPSLSRGLSKGQWRRPETPPEPVEGLVEGSAVIQENPDELLYSTLLGGGGGDGGMAIAVDGAGNAYVTGTTDSPDFPTTPGAFNSTFRARNPFVVKLNTDGTELAYATFLGGSADGGSLAIAVDGSGVAYITGETWSRDFPITAGAFDTSHNGYYDTFVTKLNATGSALIYSTFLGGSGSRGSGIAVDENGEAYVVGRTTSGFPITSGAFDTTHNGGLTDAFIAKLNATGSALVYATYLGGSGGDCWGEGCAIAVDRAGNAYIVAATDSSDFPTTSGAFDTTYNGNYDAIVAELNATGSALVYATYVGGSDDDCYFRLDTMCAIAIDEAGSAYVTGATESRDFPITPGAPDTTYNGPSEAFVIKVDAEGIRLAYATYLGGSDDDWGRSVVVDGASNAYVTGQTGSSDFPVTESAFDTSYNGHGDAFVVKVNTRGTTLVYATFLGGSNNDCYYGVCAITVDRMGNAYVTGQTVSSSFPTTVGAFDTHYNGGAHDAFIAKLAMGGSGPMPTATSTAPPTPVGGGGKIAFRSERDGQSEIYVMKPDGTGLTRITNHSAFDGHPGWSPDGERIVFMSQRDGNSEIYMMNADGSGANRLTNHSAYDGEPVWSPDGRYIAFHSDRDGPGEIYRISLSGMGLTNLTRSPYADYGPWWSPDGQRIAFVSFRSGHNKIYIMNSDGSGATCLTCDASIAEASMPAWSPDGQRIAFHGMTNDQFDIYVINIDGTGLTNITNSPAGDGEASWSPDSQYIAFQSDRSGNQDIYVIKADGTGLTQITDDPANDYNPAWSSGAVSEITPTPTIMARPTGSPTPTPTGTLYYEGYLPLIRRNPAPAATPTPTSTPTPAVCDAGFENGSTFASCWSHGGELPASLVTQLYNDDPPHTGHYSALLGNPDWGVGWPDPIPAGSAWIEQRIQVPDTSNPRLTFFYRIASYDVMQGTRLWDTLDVTINGTPNVVFRDGPDRPPANQGTLYDGGWKLAAVDLSAWRGQEVVLRFAVWNREYDPRDGTDYYNTWAYLDQVQVER